MDTDSAVHQVCKANSPLLRCGSCIMTSSLIRHPGWTWRKSTIKTNDKCWQKCTKLELKLYLWRCKMVRSMCAKPEFSQKHKNVIISLSSGHRTGKGQFSFQSQRKAMPKNGPTTAQLHSSHMLTK